MNRKEVFEFLELPENTPEIEISTRIEDKLAYFTRLSENAPNDFLKKLHLQNIEKVQTIKKMLIQVTVAAPTQVENHAVQNPSFNTRSSHNNHSAPLQQDKSAVAWLVRHTENKSAKTFPLYYGDNFIGRNPQTTSPSIIIHDDPYISRIHALLNVIELSPLKILVSDDAASNSGKPSKNGTYVNGDHRRLSKKVTIKENDTIQIGMTKFIVRLNNTSIQKIVHEVEESDYMKTVVIDLF